MGGEGSSHVIFGMPEPKGAAILYINLVLILLVYYCHLMFLLHIAK